jgi:hypothetical protein
MISFKYVIQYCIIKKNVCYILYSNFKMFQHLVYDTLKLLITLYKLHVITFCFHDEKLIHFSFNVFIRVKVFIV